MFLLVVSFRALPVAGCASCESAGPDQPKDQPAWLAALKAERDSVLKKVNFTGGVFGTPELAWTQTNYLQPQMHPYDRFFYDPTVGYTVDKYLDDLTTRYGGVDSILMWPTYTNIGSDDRNQFDYFRAMPGGLDGVRNVTLQLKARGVRVLWPYNPWDHGTHREPLSDEQTFAKLLKRTNGDGFNGDTMDFVPGALIYNVEMLASTPTRFSLSLPHSLSQNRSMKPLLTSTTLLPLSPRAVVRTKRSIGRQWDGAIGTTPPSLALPAISS